MAEVATGIKTPNIAELTRLVRMQEWVAITFYPLLIPFYYLLLLRNGQYVSYIAGFLQIFIFGLLCGSFAFSLNTVCDLAQDRKAGKQYTLSTWAGTRLFALLLALSAAAALVLASLAHYDKRFWLVGLLIYLLSVGYSAPLLRLKERPVLGPLTIALTQFALPQLLVFVLFEFYSWETVLFIMLFFLTGLRGILFHQILDYGNDLQASVRTFVTAFGVKRTWHALTLLTAIEICVLVATLAVCTRTVSGILIYAVGLAALGFLRNRGTASLMPRPYTMLLEVYCFFWPMFLLAYGAAYVQWIFVVLLLLHGFVTLLHSASFRLVLRTLYGRIALSIRF
jgi:4-hydroxybenzoate polyprenyltransferase